MRKLINVSIIILILASFCILEQILVRIYLTEMEDKINVLSSVVYNSENIESQEINEKLTEAENYWKNKMSTLSLFVNFREVEDINVELVKLKTHNQTGDEDAFKESLNLIKMYLETYKIMLYINYQTIL